MYIFVFKLVKGKTQYSQLLYHIRKKQTPNIFNTNIIFTPLLKVYEFQ